MSATSCGPTFRTSFGAIRAGLNCRFGGFNGFAPVYLHEQFIGDMCRVPFPEPGSLALLGLGLVGLGLSRRRKPLWKSGRYPLKRGTVPCSST